MYSETLLQQLAWLEAVVQSSLLCKQVPGWHCEQQSQGLVLPVVTVTAL
jgi:hypothetical protein